MASGLARGMGAKVGALMGGGNPSYDDVTAFRIVTTSASPTWGVYSGTLANGSSSCVVDWDAEAGHDYETVTAISQLTHTYTTPGEHVVTFSDDLSVLTPVGTTATPWNGTYNLLLTEVINYAPKCTSAGSGAFYGSTNLTTVQMNNVITASSIASGSVGTFRLCSNLESLQADSWDGDGYQYSVFQCGAHAPYNKIRNISLPGWLSIYYINYGLYLKDCIVQFPNVTSIRNIGVANSLNACNVTFGKITSTYLLGVSAWLNGGYGTNVYHCSDGKKVVYQDGAWIAVDDT